MITRFAQPVPVKEDQTSPVSAEERPHGATICTQPASTRLWRKRRHFVASVLRGVCLGFAILGVSAAGMAQFGDRDTHGVPGTSATAPPPEARADINHASVDELMKVPGMTRSWAGRIVRFRPYRTKQDLLENGIVTSEVYDRIKDFVIAHRDKP
jgi:DNA uptake protein ComE-like DNA-binding protein